MGFVLPDISLHSGTEFELPAFFSQFGLGRKRTAQRAALRAIGVVVYQFFPPIFHPTALPILRSWRPLAPRLQGAAEAPHARLVITLVP